MSLLTDGDYSVKPWAKYGVVLIILLVGGYFVRTAWNKGGKPEDAKLLCVDCGYGMSRALEIGEAPPLKCPKCGKQSVYPAIQCPKCGTPTVWNTDRGLKGPTKCPKCGTEIERSF